MTMLENSRGDWMQTATGRRFWPMDPRADDVSIEDIAHALSMLCRFGGHCLKFYSVAEHSVLLSRLAPPQYKLWALLHDAAEAYMVDLPRPLKSSLPEYKVAEAKVMRAISVRFHLHLGCPDEVKALDQAILADEREQNMAESSHPWEQRMPDPLGIKLQFWDPERARAQFLAQFDALYHPRDAWWPL